MMPAIQIAEMEYMLLHGELNCELEMRSCLDEIKRLNAQLTAAHDRERVLKEKVEHLRTLAYKLSLNESGRCRECMAWEHRPGSTCPTGLALANETEDGK